VARPGTDARGPAAGAASFSGNSGFGTSNGHSAGGHALDAAAAEPVVEERVAVEPAASVTDSPVAAPEDPPAGDSVGSASDIDSTDMADEDAEPVPAAAVPARPRADPGAAARMFDAATTTTRRRSVVFEEDDELDVPDFLK
jgi:cell division protein FtsZ